MIPLANPKANYLAYKQEIDQAINQVLNSGQYILGENVELFEQEFATYIGSNYGIGVASGTDALILALRACEIGNGDKVITVSHTAVATVAAIELVGAKPILIDIEADSYTLDPNVLTDILKILFKSKSNRPKAIVVVHLYGQPANLPEIIKLAQYYNLYLIEDSAQAHGASFMGRKLGSWGHLSTFSFYPTKNLSAIGDAGMIVTNDIKLSEKLKLIRQYGWQTRYVSNVIGTNSRLDELQAAILRVKLKYLDIDNQKRRKIAQIYDQGLINTDLILPKPNSDALSVYYQYVVRTKNRDNLLFHLHKNNILASIHFPLPIHLQPAYKNRLALIKPLPITEKIAKEIISLPIYPELTKKEVNIVIDQITKAPAN
ncbi:MAG: DegT/DnrJ/EryC1/StrS family aminotransferase [Blastocatellia bacterium]